MASPGKALDRIFPQLKRTPLKRSKKRIQSKSKKPSKALKHKLDAAVSKMVHQRDANLLCIACKREQGNQTGHFVRREMLSTRWHPQNVNLQCFYCNGPALHGNLFEYGLGLVDKYGKGVPESLIALGRTSWKPSREALEALLATAKVGHEAYAETWNFYGSEK